MNAFAAMGGGEGWQDGNVAFYQITLDTCYYLKCTHDSDALADTLQEHFMLMFYDCLFS